MDSVRGSSISAATVWATRSPTVGMLVSYCVPFQALLGLGLDVGWQLGGGGDPVQAGGFHVGGQADPHSPGGAAAAGQVAVLGPVVDDVGLDAEVGGDVGDGVLVVAAGAGVDVFVLVGGAGRPVAAGGLGLGWEWYAPAAGVAAAGGQEPGGDPVVDGAGGHPDAFGHLAWGEFTVGEQAWVRDSVVVAQVGGGDRVEGLPGAGAVPGLVERCGQGGVVQAGADAAGEFDRGRVGAAQLDGVAAPGDRELLAGPGSEPQPDRQLGGVHLGWCEGDVSDQGTQQPLAVLVAGGFGCPQRGQVGHGGGQLVGAGQLGLGVGLCGQGRVGLGQFGQRGLPPGLQAAGDEPVFRFAGK